MSDHILDSNMRVIAAALRAGDTTSAALVDEADSVLIDEARTPLIIGLTQPNDPATCHSCLESPPALDGIRAPYEMEGTIKEAIHNLKYRGLKAAAPELA